MTVLRIEHPVPNFEAWKQAFDADPVGRERSGVRRYRILRATDDPNYVMIDLEFDTADDAEALLASMRVIGVGSRARSYRTHGHGSWNPSRPRSTERPSRALLVQRGR